MLRSFLALSALALLLAACGGSPSPTATPTTTSNQQSGAEGLQVMMVQSVLTVGPNRFAIGLLDGDSLVKNAKLTMSFVDLDGDHKVSNAAPATFREAPDGIAAIYTVDVSFPKAGSWGVIIQGATADGKPIAQNVEVDVVASSHELTVGKKAPAAKSPTLDSVNGDFKRITSAPKPNANFYRLSLDQAIASGKPTLVLFSTPAFCTSRLCGPAYDVMDSVYPAYADKVNFVHVEVYKDLPNPNLAKPQLADAMIAWGLTSEPWTYLLNKEGIVVWRVEGLVTADEVKVALDRVLGT